MALVQVFGCRNPNATVPADPRQYMCWITDEVYGRRVNHVILTGIQDYMGSEQSCSLIPHYNGYNSFLNNGWTPMNRDELRVHFHNMTDSTTIGIPMNQ